MDVDLLSHEGRFTLRFERRLAHPPEKVWRALTEREHLSQWYPFSAMEIDLRTGGAIRFDDGEGSTLEAVITELDPPRVFAFRTPAGEMLDREGDNLLHFELRPDDEGSLLVFTHTFDDRPAAASYAAGWTLCLDALEMVVEGRPVEWGSPPAELHEAFVEKFGLNVGSTEDTPEGWLVRFERQFMGASIDQVWATLNASGPGVPTGEASSLMVGGPVLQAFTTEKVPPGAVTAVDPPTLLEYEWQFEGRTAGRVRWELSHGPGGARLTLTQTGPGELAGERSTALAAWQTHIERLARQLQGEQ